MGCFMILLSQMKPKTWLTSHMKSDKRVYGQAIKAPRLTPLGAALLAAIIALPAGSLIGLVAWLIK